MSNFFFFNPRKKLSLNVFLFYFTSQRLTPVYEPRGNFGMGPAWTLTLLRVLNQLRKKERVNVPRAWIVF